MKFVHVLRVVVIVVLLCDQCVIAAENLGADVDNTCFSTLWPSELSDLKPDPSLVRGKLDNGFRYVLKENSEPRNRVAVYLNIQAGSLHETRDERGFAHFLEHMLFNGSTHFPPGRLVEYFQSIGMSFGGDTNAHTSYDETVYKIILPEGSEQQLRNGLLVMADYARGALLLDSEIDRERGVILAEKRTRDSAEYRAHVAASSFALRGTRMPERMPIGVSEVLQRADHTLLKKFYDSWYRPENMVLVIVGDMVPADVVPLLEEFFSPLTAADVVPECPEFGSLEHSGLEAFYHYEEELGRTDVSIETLWNKQRQNDSYALQVNELREDVGAMIMQHRIEKLKETSNIPFTGAGYYSGDILQRVGYGAITAQTDPGKWQETLQILEATLRQALVFGFSEDELARVKRDILADIETAVLTADTRDSLAVATAIIRELNDNRVFQSPEQERELFTQAVSALTLAEVNRAFRAIWSRDSRLVSVSGNTHLTSDAAAKTILGQYHQASKQKIAAIEFAAQTDFPYLDISAAETFEPTRQDRFTDIDVERVEFANGVVVNMKKTEFLENRIQIAVDFGYGKLGEPKPGLSLLAEAIVNSSGTARLQKSELADILAGSTVNFRFHVGEASFSLTGDSVSTDIELLFQLLHTVMRDPGMREEAYQRAMQGIEQMYEQLQRDVGGAMQFTVSRFLAGGDKRIGLPLRGDITLLRSEDVRSWLLPQFRESRMEVSIVGDFQRDQIVSLAGTYFGSLPKRHSTVPDVAPLTFPVGQEMTTTVNTSMNKALVVVAWPTADFWDINRTRRLHILADVFEERLRKIIREKLGATYSPVVSSSGSRVYPGYGFLLAQMVVEPGREKDIREEILKIGEQLRVQGVTAEDLELVKGPMLTSLKDTVRKNSYWLRSVLSLSSRHPQQLDWPTTILEDFSAITADEISSLARTYLAQERAATAVVLPASIQVDGP